MIAGHGTNDVGLLLLLLLDEIGRRVEVLVQGGRIQAAAVTPLEYGRTAQKRKHGGQNRTIASPSSGVGSRAHVELDRVRGGRVTTTYIVSVATVGLIYARACVRISSRTIYDWDRVGFCGREKEPVRKRV